MTTFAFDETHDAIVVGCRYAVVVVAIDASKTGSKLPVRAMAIGSWGI
jgi:hypothetical protein